MDTRLPLDQHVDILAIGAYPNNVEIGVGGILLKMAHRGYTTVICDLTRQEVEIGDNPDEPSTEAEKAAKILHISDRVNLDLGGSPLALNLEQAQALAECIRLYRPDIILAPHWEDWNPDHSITSQLIQRAIHLVRFKKWDKSFEPYTPSWVFYYPFSKPIIPQVIVNITSTYEGKLEAIKAYQARFTKTPHSDSPFSPSYRDFIFHIESRARHFGYLANCRFGEGLILGRPIPIEDICEFTSL